MADMQEVVSNQIENLKATEQAFKSSAHADATIAHFVALAEFSDVRHKLEADASPETKELLEAMERAEIENHKVVQYDFFESEDGSWVEYHNATTQRGVRLGDNSLELLDEGWEYDFPSVRLRLVGKLFEAGVPQLPQSVIRDYLDVIRVREMPSPEPVLDSDIPF